MTKFRVFLFAAVAVAIALGTSGQAMASKPTVSVTMKDVRNPMPAGPNVTAPAIVGVTAFGLPPQTAGAFPCFGPNAPCTGDPAGGLLVGIPIQYVPISGTTNCTTVPCGQAYQTFQTTTGHGKLGLTITIKQGTTTIFTFHNANVGTAAANQIGIVDLNGLQLDTTAVAGNAIMTITTKVGTKSLTGKTTLVLQ